MVRRPKVAAALQLPGPPGRLVCLPGADQLDTRLDDNGTNVLLRAFFAASRRLVVSRLGNAEQWTQLASSLLWHGDCLGGAETTSPGSRRSRISPRHGARFRVGVDNHRPIGRRGNGD